MQPSRIESRTPNNSYDRISVLLCRRHLAGGFRDRRFYQYNPADKRVKARLRRTPVPVVFDFSPWYFRPLPRNKYPEETVQKILDAALRLFLEKGYEQTTILDIVDEMGGLTRGAYYHHFKSKEEVLDALTTKLFCDDNLFEHAKKQKGLTGLEEIKLMLVKSFQDSSSIHRKISMEAMQLLRSSSLLKSLLTITAIL